MLNQSGLKISVQGKDVKTAAGDDVIFDSNQASMTARLRKPATVHVDSSTGVGTMQLYHGFGYMPQMICMVITSDITDDDAQYINVPSTWHDSSTVLGGETEEIFDCYHIDNNTIEVSVTNQWYAVHGGGIAGHWTEDYTFDVILLMEEMELV